MNIYQITANYPPHLGGMQQRIKELSDLLTSRGHKVTILTSNQGNYGKLLVKKRNQIIKYLWSFELFNTPIIPKLAIELLRVPRKAIVHVHVAQTYIPEIVYIVSLIKKFKYVAHIRLDIAPSGILGFLIPFYKRFFLKTFLQRARKTIVLTEDYVPLMINKYDLPPEKIIVIPNGTYFPENKRRISRLHNPIRLLFVGRLEYQKNLPLLLKSFAKLRKIQSNFRLDIVGDGSMKDYLREQIKKMKLESCVTLLGRLSGVKLIDKYIQSDLLVTTTNVEGCSNVLVEAMKSRLPIVATDVSGVRSIIKHEYNGLLVKSDSRQIATDIHSIVSNDKLRCALIDNASKEVLKYDWNSVVQQIEVIYKNVQNSV